MIKILYKTDPMAHQHECLDISKDLPAWGVLLEQGLGKTKIVIDNAAYLYSKSRINGLLVLAPNGVHGAWIRNEIPKHLYDNIPRMMLEYSSSKTSTKKFQKAVLELMGFPGLAVLSMNIEALSSSKKAVDFCRLFLKSRNGVLLVVDESTRIKTPQAACTKRALALSKITIPGSYLYKRILNGTPVTQSPLDLFSQFNFLGQELLGFKSYYAFKNRYAQWKTETAYRGPRKWSYDTLVRYQNLDELTARMQKHSYRRTKEECLDLPPKVYKVMPLDMSKEQAKLYRTMEEQGLLEFDDLEILTKHHLTKLMRLQQITGGFVPTDSPERDPGRAIPGTNPKIAWLVAALKEDYKGKAIIWARFRYEHALIKQALTKEFGKEAIVYLTGEIPGEQRQSNIDRFQNDPRCLFIIGQPSCGIGYTAHAAKHVFYYSNSFSYYERYQSEDRAHRIGLDHTVVYVDLVMKDTVDEKVGEVLKKAKAMADVVTGDASRVIVPEPDIIPAEKSVPAGGNELQAADIFAWEEE